MSYRKFSISMDEKLLARVDAVAKAETRNRSQQISHLVGLALAFQAKPNPHAGAKSLEDLHADELVRALEALDEPDSDGREVRRG